MINRKPLPHDQSKMYVYVQDIIDQWKQEFLLEIRKNARTDSDLQRLYMIHDGIKKDSKESVPINE